MPQSSKAPAAVRQSETVEIGRSRFHVRANVRRANADEGEGERSRKRQAMFRIGVEVDLVDLIFTATDKHGHFIKDLKKEDVRLLDEGKPPVRIEAFESETGLPLRVGLLIDASNSIRDRFHFEQDAAVEFLHQVVRPNRTKRL